MTQSPVSTTIYLEPHIHQALKFKARNNGLTISEVVDDAVSNMLHDDDLDLLAYAASTHESREGLNKQH